HELNLLLDTPTSIDGKDLKVSDLVITALIDLNLSFMWNNGFLDVAIKISNILKPVKIGVEALNRLFKEDIIYSDEEICDVKEIDILERSISDSMKSNNILSNSHNLYDKFDRYERTGKLSSRLLKLKEALMTVQPTSTQNERSFSTASNFAIQAHRYTNCLTDVIEDAEKYIDDEKNGIFEGVPVSFKDGINVEGCYRTLGCTLFAKRVCKENDPIVNVMIMEGAVPFVKTNMAQLGFSFSCSNPIYGETFNPIGIPKGIQYTPGGSSGGEAALIRFGGSIL
ncbi:hypothetical protein A3Q56_07874, partial [Intoshia linei]